MVSGRAAVIAGILALAGSYFLNIKEHAEDGERSLYVKDLLLAHRRQWGWRFVDEFCWRNTRNGVPGGWDNRFKNAGEPVFHFTRSAAINFYPMRSARPPVTCSPIHPTIPNPQAAANCWAAASGKTRAPDGLGRAT
jgi:hypothetical protein